MRQTTHDPYRTEPLDVPQLDPESTDLLDRPVRILALVDRYPPWINAGAEWMLHSIFRRMIDKGHEVMVATDIPEHFDPQYPEDVDGVQVHPSAAAEDLADVADVIVGHLLWTKELVGLASRHRLPLMYLLHNESQIGHWNLEPRNVTVVVPNSEWVAAAALGFWHGPSFVCRPPVFCADYAVPSDEDREYITLVNLIPEKGVDTFYAMARLRYRQPFLAVTGAYGHQHRPMPDCPNVTLLPPTANMRDDVYAKSRVLLMPSWYESWGRVAVEAMAAGVPVIAHPTPGLVEALGTGAIFAEARDHRAYADALKMLDTKREWKRRQKAGRARAAELEQLTDADLDTFEIWLRRCATLARR